MSQLNFKKQYFPEGSNHGITSFKYVSYPNEVKLLIHRLRQKQTARLHDGVGNGDSGISLTIESPVFCPDYAEINVSRNVPLRQYFGEEINQNVDGSSHRTCYGVGSGASTVGSDPLTNKTRLMCNDMKQMCDYLSTNDHLFKSNNRTCSKRLRFNHVTVLYYLSKSPSHRINLNAHCDVEVTVNNDFRAGNSQKEATPTVVLSFCSKKEIVFHKRYAGLSKFGAIKRVCSMDLNDGDMFVLHPQDERVVQRNIKMGWRLFEWETDASQFKHAVSFSSKNKNVDGTPGCAVSISVCFREVRTTANFHPISNTVMTTQVENESEAKVVIHPPKKAKLIHNKRKDIKDKDKRRELTEELRTFFESIKH